MSAEFCPAEAAERRLSFPSLPPGQLSPNPPLQRMGRVARRCARGVPPEWLRRDAPRPGLRGGAEGGVLASGCSPSWTCGGAAPSLTLPATASAPAAAPRTGWTAWTSWRPATARTASSLRPNAHAPSGRWRASNGEEGNIYIYMLYVYIYICITITIQMLIYLIKFTNIL